MTAWTGLTCIIPAWNEAGRIGAVLRVAARHPALDEVIVVDDGSTDATAAIAAAIPGVRLIRQPRNGGKTRALVTGIAAARHDHLMLLDADLTGLTATDLDALIAPVRDGRAQASLSLRANAPRLWHRLGIDYISGERVMTRADLPPDLHALAGFGFEVALNRHWVARGLRLAVVPWPGVKSPPKATKRGALAGIAADLAMLRDMARTVPPLQLARQIRAMQRLRVS